MSSTSFDDKKSIPSHGLPVQTYSAGNLSLATSVGAATLPSSELSSTLSEAEQRRIWRKLDLRLLPFVSLLYLFSFLDRANIAAVFFVRFVAASIPYAIFEIPSNIALKIFRPSIWIPAIMLSWGIVMACMSRVESFSGLLVARVVLGMTETGLFPGVTYYISLWYPRRLQAKRVALFFSSGSLAGAFGGILAYGIERLDGRGGLHGWQWIFLLEGLMTVILAMLSFFFMHDYPETATFLTEEERAFVVTTLKAESMGQSTHVSATFVWQALLDWKSWVQVGMYIGVLVPVFAVALFMPSIIAELGFANAEAQLLTIPPFIAGCALTIVAGIYSDRIQRRGIFCLGGALLAMVGYIIAYTTSAPGPGYTSTFIATCGVYPVIAVALAWAGGNAGGDLKRGVVIAMVIGISNLGGICSSFIYYDPPLYHHGHGTMLGFLGLSVICCCILMFTYDRLNKQKEEYCRREGITLDMAPQFVDMGDKSPLFRYVL
ncbi:MFS general substrate transporter [Peniophora sp. CONT]|nr:MFS general substrate transporter [Peniophora sp. CONT]